MCRNSTRKSIGENDRLQGKLVLQNSGIDCKGQNNLTRNINSLFGFSITEKKIMTEKLDIADLKSYISLFPC